MSVSVLVMLSPLPPGTASQVATVGPGEALALDSRARLAAQRAEADSDVISVKDGASAREERRAARHVLSIEVQSTGYDCRTGARC